MPSPNRVALIERAFWADPMVRQLPAVTKVVALYTMTGPCSKPTGLYRLDPAVAEDDLQIPAGKLKKSLSILEKKGFCSSDGEIILVKNMAAYQISDALGRGDPRVITAIKSLLEHADTYLLWQFCSVYVHKWTGLDAIVSGEWELGGALHDLQHSLRASLFDIARSCEEWGDFEGSENAQSVLIRKLREPIPECLQDYKKINTQKKEELAARKRAPGADAPKTTFSAAGGSGPVSAVEASEVSGASFPHLAAENTAQAVLERLRHASTAAPGAPLIDYQRRDDGSRAAVLSGGGAAQEPWVVSPAAMEAIGGVLGPPPLYTRPAPPLLPGADSPPQDDDEALWEAMLLGWRGAYSLQHGKAWKGRVKISDSTVAGARILRAEKISPWLFFRWCWTLDNMTPRWKVVASGKFVSKHWESAREYTGPGPKVPDTVTPHSSMEIYSLQTAARFALAEARPTTAEQTAMIVHAHIDKEKFSLLCERAESEIAKLRNRDTADIAKGLWIWKYYA